MKIKEPLKILYIIAGTFTVSGVFTKLFDLIYAPYLFSVGVGILIFLHGKQAFDQKENDKRKARIARIGFITSLMLGLAAYFMFTSSRNSWVPFVLIYSLSTFFQSFRGNS